MRVGFQDVLIVFCSFFLGGGGWAGAVYSVLSVYVLFCLFRLIYTLNLLDCLVFLGFFPGLRGINFNCDFRLFSNLCFMACGCNFSCDYL